VNELVSRVRENSLFHYRGGSRHRVADSRWIVLGFDHATPAIDASIEKVLTREVEPEPTADAVSSATVERTGDGGLQLTRRSVATNQR